MKEYSVQLSKPAQTYLSKLDRPTKERIVKCGYKTANRETRSNQTACW